MRKPGGQVTISMPDGPVVERDTFSCGHCNRIVEVQARQRPEDLGGLCKQCMQLVCPHCYNEGRCTPLEKQLEISERRQIALRSYGFDV